MLTKQDYRVSFNAMKKYIKVSNYARDFGLSQTCLSMFMKDSSYDYMISLDKLDNFYNYIVTRLNEY